MMAGRFVVLKFDDPDSANAFVANNHMPHHLGFSIMAMFVLPVQFCDCPDKRRQNIKNWARGSRSGIWICRVCKKPSVYHMKGLLERLEGIFGYNQIKAD
jgi:hypothetical protein